MRALRLSSLIALLLISHSSYANVLLQAYNAREVTIKIVGEITDEDLQDFKDTLKKIEEDKSVLHMNAVQLDSGGGDPSVAMEIGKLIRARRLNTYIAPDDSCASACVYIAVAGVMRYAFGDVRVHRTSFGYEPPDTSMIAGKVEEWRKESAAYFASMNISNMLVDAVQSTPNWQIRSITDSEKRQWQLIGADQLTEETLFTEIAKERSISRTEFIHIYKQSYEQCLQQAKLFNQTTFECAKDRKVKKISHYQHWMQRLQDWINRTPQTTTFIQTYEQNVRDLWKKIDQGRIYLRCSGRSNTDPPCRFNIDPGRIVAFALGNCG